MRRPKHIGEDDLELRNKDDKNIEGLGMAGTGA